MGLALAVVSSALNAASDFRFALSSTEIRPGEQVRLELTLVPDTALAGDLTPVLFDDLLTTAKQFHVLDRDSRRHGPAWVWTYTLTSYRPGEVSLPPISVTLGSEAFSTESKKLRTRGSRAAEDEELRPDFTEVSYPVPWRRVFQWGLIASATVFSLRQVWLWWRKRPRRKRKLEPVVLIDLESPEDWLRRELAALRLVLETSEEALAAVDALSLVVRGYFARKSAQPARAYTLAEFRRSFESDPKGKAITPVLEECDYFRFASPVKDGARVLGLSFLNKSEAVLLA